MKSKNAPSVVITSCYTYQYFEWFILGFHLLKEKGEVKKVKLKTPLFTRLFMRLPLNDFCLKVLCRIKNKFIKSKPGLSGYVLFRDESGKKLRRNFYIDNSDSPFLFNCDALEKTSVYFKMQYPLDLEKDHFDLTPPIHIPWCDLKKEDPSNPASPRKPAENLPKYRYKIKPLMIGTRQLSPGLNKRKLKKAYANYLRSQRAAKDNKLVCYFGNSLGPKPRKTSTPDYDWEADLLYYFGDQINHPNEKRQIVADYINEVGGDGRVIHQGNSDSGLRVRNDLFVPLKDFCDFISSFEYNVNVSGYRLSIPNRFIESFMVGTAIVTDKLHVKWYLPFDDEVVETVEMGYLPMDQVDWPQFKNDLENLPKTDPQKIIDNFNKKWAPEVVARYMLKEIKDS